MVCTWQVNSRCDSFACETADHLTVLFTWAVKLSPSFAPRFNTCVKWLYFYPPQTIHCEINGVVKDTRQASFVWPHLVHLAVCLMLRCSHLISELALSRSDYSLQRSGLVEQQLLHFWIHKDKEQIMCTCENDYLMAQAFTFLSSTCMLDTNKLMIGHKLRGKEWIMARRTIRIFSNIK